MKRNHLLEERRKTISPEVAESVKKEAEKIENEEKAMTDPKLSIHQIQLMQHAIGFDRSRIKKNKYKAYRNRYIDSQPNEEWEELVVIGYAAKREFKEDKQICYYVSDLGMKCLGDLMGCVIEEMD